MKVKRCGNCGSNEVRPQDQKNKAFPFKDYSNVYLRRSLVVPECTICHELVMSAGMISELTEALKQSVSEDVRSFIKTILEREECSQADLATHVGVTEEYLSEIKSGRKQPAFQTYNILKLVASLDDAFEIANPSFDAVAEKISA
jgi:ribosome-binding protein aMBF1 (putative translation factor)